MSSCTYTLRIEAFIEVDFMCCYPIVPLKYEDVRTVRVGFLK